jgi:hypothetical protein
MAALLAASAAYALLVWLISPESLKRDFGTLAPLIRSEWSWLALIAIGIGAPLSEELLFRGFLLPALSRSRIGFWGAAVLLTLAWTALHASYSIYGLIQVAAIGMLFCWLLWRTGSLVLPIACHAAYNIIIFALILVLPIDV